MNESGLALLFDLETSGLPPKDLRDTEGNLYPRWDQAQRYPYICEIGYMLVDAGNPDEILVQENLLIKPDGWTLSHETQAITGISPQLLEQSGVPIQVATSHFVELLKLEPTIVAHNIMFDWPIMQIELLRSGYQIDQDYSGKLTLFCTMLSMIEYCRIPGKYQDFKWPTLAEIHQALFKQPMSKRGHRALNDVDTMRICLKKMIDLNVVRIT